MSTQLNAVLIKHDISKADCQTLRKTDRWPTNAPPFTKVASVLFHVFPPGNTLKHLPCLSSSFDMWHSSLGSFPFHGYSSLGCSEHGCMCMRVGRGGKNSKVGRVIKEYQEAFLWRFSVGTGHFNLEGWVKATVIWLPNWMTKTDSVALTQPSRLSA